MKQPATPASAPRGRDAPSRIHGKIARDLGIAIVAGRHKPGETLLGELAFAAKNGVSRSAYREAIRMLAAKGLISSRPKVGITVNAERDWNLLDIDVLAWIFVKEPNAIFVQGLFELRAIVEPAAAALAAERRDSGDLARMGHALEEMAAHGLAVQEGRAADQRFHHAILEATRNPVLISLSSSIAAAVGWTTLFKHRKGALPRDALPEHRMLYDAIAAKDARAARDAAETLVKLALVATEAALRATE